jgi:hypothetical protein
LPPKSVTEFEDVPSHDEFEPGDDGFGRESSGQFVGPEECGDSLKGVVRIYVCVHRYGVTHEESGVWWQLRESFKAFDQLEGAGNKGRQFSNQRL